VVSVGAGLIGDSVGAAGVRETGEREDVVGRAAWPGVDGDLGAVAVAPAYRPWARTWTPALARWVTWDRSTVRLRVAGRMWLRRVRSSVLGAGDVDRAGDRQVVAVEHLVVLRVG
jgi:hypothetical protein